MITSSFDVSFSLHPLIGTRARVLNTGWISRLGCRRARFWSWTARSLGVAGALPEIYVLFTGCYMESCGPAVGPRAQLGLVRAKRPAADKYDERVFPKSDDAGTVNSRGEVGETAGVHRHRGSSTPNGAAWYTASSDNWDAVQYLETSTKDAAEVQVAMNPRGDAIVVWAQNDSTAKSIWGNLFE